MNPTRISLKFAARPVDAGAPDLAAAIPIFHRCIQQGSLEGLLLDVADYRHVPDGPGVLLVGHDVDYGVEATGLCVVRKRQTGPIAQQLRDALRMGLGALKILEEDGGLGLHFDPAAFRVALLDRSFAANDAAGASALEGEVASVLSQVFGEAKLEISRTDADDPRDPLAVCVSLPDGVDVDAALAALGAAREPARAPLDPPQSDWDVSVEDLKRLRDDGADFVLVDVRGPDEFEICNLEGKLIPLGELPDRLDELPKDGHVVVYCKVGGRSSLAVDTLRDAGFSNAWSVNGGILRWIDRIDPSLQRY